MTQPPANPDDDASGHLLRRAWRDDEAPPAVVRARAVALHDPARRIAGRATATLRRLVAVLIGDEGGAGFAPAFGVRGAAPAGSQWLFKAESCEIDLRLRGGDDDGWTLSGQLFGAPGARAVVLSQADAAERTLELGPTTEFAFAGLAAGSYVLTVRADALEIVVPAIEVGRGV